MANHPNRRSINGALFDAFLEGLRATTNASAPAGYHQEDLREVLRRASVTLAIKRVNEERVHRLRRAGVEPRLLKQAPDQSLYVVIGTETQAPVKLDYDDLRRHHLYISRSLQAELAESIR